MNRNFCTDLDFTLEGATQKGKGCQKNTTNIKKLMFVIANPYNLQDEDVSPEIRFLKGGFLTIERATASMMIMNPDIVVNPHLHENLKHFLCARRKKVILSIVFL